MQGEVERLITAVPDVDWSVCVRVDGTVRACIAPERVLPTASIGKVLLLLEVARRIVDGDLDPRKRLNAEPEDRVGDSGLWQHLPEAGLAIESLAVLVAAVSDNQATNVLLRAVGIASVERVSIACGVPGTRVLDRIRKARTDTDPPWPSEGRADELARLMAMIAEGDALSPAASELVAHWLALDVDTSMVAGALGLDPLAHLDGPIRLFHKTGTDAGVRADAGHATGPSGACSYAVLARWDAQSTDRTDAVLHAMHAIGGLIREVVR